MMLSYFPETYPDELLYSVLARWLRHQGAVGMTNPLQQVFGRRFACASLDIPGWIGRLATVLPAERALTADALIDKLTLFPYYTAYLSASMRRAFRQAMAAGTVSGWHMRLGITAFRVGRVRSLRFCSECLHDMERRYGEIYWARSHQLPGVVVCPKHGCALQYASHQGDQGRYGYVAASHLECSPKSPRIQVPEGNALALLWKVARKSAELLDYPGEARDFEALTVHYRKRMARSGLAWSACRMKTTDFLRAFDECYGEAIACLSAEWEGIGLYREWLPGMVRKHRKLAHPLQHLILETFFDSRAQSEGPFGDGPWPCCNPIAPHVGSLTVTSVTRHRNRGHDVGVFACTCGYVYTRRFVQATGVLESPRVRQFGPLLDVELKRLVERGSKLRPAARALRIDPKTVARRAHELRLQVTWKDPPRRNRTPDAIAQTQKNPAQARGHLPRSKRHPRKHWTDIDSTLMHRIHAEADSIRRIDPPHRVSRAELERRVCGRDWIYMRLHKLPECKAALGEETEDAATFHDRRLQWAVRTLADGNTSVPLWRLANRIGVTAASLRESLAQFSARTLP